MTLARSVTFADNPTPMPSMTRFGLVPSFAALLGACNATTTSEMPAGAAGAIGGVPSAQAAKTRPGARTPRIPPAVVAPSGQESGKLAGILTAHNDVRAGVGVAPLVWSTTLGAHAQQWADHLKANGCNLAHRPPDADSYGENVFWSSNGSTASGVVAQWAAEKAAYDHAANACTGVCGHYTQIVWAATTKLGCGMAACGAAEVWVCNYDPQGNVMGQSPY